MTTKRIVIILSFVALLVVGFIVLSGSRKAEGPPQGGITSAPAPAGQVGMPKSAPALPVLAAEVGRRTMQQTLEVTGSLKTDEDVQIGSRLAGKVVRVTVKEGDRVSQGQVLVQLDDRELRAQIARAQGSLASAQARLSFARNSATAKDATATSDYDRAQAALSAAKSRVQQAETNLKLVDTETKLRVANAETGVKMANERLAIAKDATRRQELRTAELEVDRANGMLGQAKVDAETAEAVFQRRQELYKQDAISKEEVDEAERRFKQMRALARSQERGVAQAQQRLELAKEGTRAEEIRIAEGQVQNALSTLDQAQSDRRRRDVAQQELDAARSAVTQAESLLRSTQAGLVQNKVSQDDIAGARATITQAQADIQFYRTQLSDLTIQAPVSGVISRRQVNVGEMVNVGATLMNLVALDTIYFEALAPELDVSVLRPGALATVSVDALAGKKFSGVVREVIPVADQDSRSFRVRISVPGGRGRLPANGYARAVVHVGTRSNTLSVSKDAVLTEAGDKFVWLLAKDEESASAGSGGVTVTSSDKGSEEAAQPVYKAKRQPITVGLVDDRYAEVLSGLKPGDRVIAAGSPAIIEGTAVTVSGGWSGGAGDPNLKNAPAPKPAPKAESAPHSGGH